MYDDSELSKKNNEKKKWFVFLIKKCGTNSVILSDPPCKDGNAQIPWMPLKPLSDQ